VGQVDTGRADRVGHVRDGIKEQAGRGGTGRGGTGRGGAGRGGQVGVRQVGVGLVGLGQVGVLGETSRVGGVA